MVILKKSLILIIILICIFYNTGCAVQTETITDQEKESEDMVIKISPDEAVQYAEDYLTKLLESEKNAGYLDSYEIIETVYEEHFVGIKPQWYNVYCVYRADYGSNNHTVYSACLEKKFMYETNSESSEAILTTVHYRIMDEQYYATYSYPTDVPYSPQIMKNDAEGKTIEQLSKELIAMFMENLSQFDEKRTFSLTGYDGIEVDRVIETKGVEWENNYWYEGQDVLPEGAVNCWVISGLYKWKYIGYIDVYGSRGNAFEENSADHWNNSVFQDAAFFIVEWPEHYSLYTNRTLPLL